MVMPNIITVLEDVDYWSTCVHAHCPPGNVNNSLVRCPLASPWGTGNLRETRVQLMRMHTDIVDIGLVTQAPAAFHVDHTVCVPRALILA